MCGGRAREEAGGGGSAQPKQEPHAKMWGKGMKSWIYDI